MIATSTTIQATSNSPARWRHHQCVGDRAREPGHPTRRQADDNRQREPPNTGLWNGRFADIVLSIGNSPVIRPIPEDGRGAHECGVGDHAVAAMDRAGNHASDGRRGCVGFGRVLWPKPTEVPASAAPASPTNVRIWLAHPVFGGPLRASPVGAYRHGWAARSAPPADPSRSTSDPAAYWLLAANRAGAAGPGRAPATTSEGRRPLGPRPARPGRDGARSAAAGSARHRVQPP